MGGNKARARLVEPATEARPRTRGSRASNRAACAQALLNDCDLMSHVLSFHSVVCGGWAPALWEAGRVCKAWREALARLRPALEQWTEFRWSIPNVSRLADMPNGVSHESLCSRLLSPLSSPPSSLP